jgi:sigma-B regulation protein RsbU (phosphoserine phosphatase)
VRKSPQPELANLPIILLTAHAGEQHEVESLQSGANDFVTKPVNAAILKARIETHLRLEALRRELEVWRENHERDLEAARATQRAILPARPPQIAGWESAAHYRPVIQVGGDMYDWLRLADGRWLFWIADATGHGASAALLTSLTKLLFRHAATELTAAHEILRAVNLEFCSVFRRKTFMTAAAVIISPGAGQIEFAGAGHPPLFLIRAPGNGRIESLASQGPPLGIDPAQAYQQTCAELAPRDLALLYTDGLFSALDGDGHHSNPEDLTPILPRDAASAHEFVTLAVEASIGGKTIPDDLALVALRRV